MSNLISSISQINQFLWSGPLLVLLMGTHLYFTMKLHFPQKKIGKAIKLSITPEKNKDSGNLSVFATLATTLAATLGTGNIVGVSTAIALGGPGAVFWCWITGILGMATAYCECYLSVLYKKKDSAGLYRGGPMYIWEYGLKRKSVGKFYAFLTVIAAFGVGCATQANAITQTTYTSFRIAPGISGFVAALLAGFVIVGGISAIGNLCMKLVPALAIVYMGSCVVLLFLGRDAILPAIKLILTDALCPRALLSGAAGSSLLLSARYGIARGLFTNEAGIGTSSIVAAASESENPTKQAFVSMTAVFWDTVVMCLLSGLVIVVNQIKHPASLRGIGDASYTEAAFLQFPVLGSSFLSVCLIAFAITTLIGWSYLGESAVLYLMGPKGVSCYKIVYIVMIFIGGILPLSFVWECTDLINAFMLLPNLLALYLLKDKIKTL